jgi:hypothetical protein
MSSEREGEGSDEGEGTGTGNCNVNGQQPSLYKPLPPCIPEGE